MVAHVNDVINAHPLKVMIMASHHTIETDSDSDQANMHVMDYEERYSSEEGEESGENEGVQEGYDCMFVEPGPADDDHRCPICRLIVRDAYQVNCCGKILCRTCLFKHKSHSSNFSCPCCRKGLGNKYFQDTRSNREILSLRVYCPHKSSGCDWTGELKKMDTHCQECLYQDVNCAKCDEQMLLCDLQDHESNRCPMRDYKCPLCNEEGKYESITGEHTETCPKVILPCKTPGCSENIERCLMPLHCKKCPLEVINCPYQDIGCNFSTERQCMEKHIENSTKVHLCKAVNRIRELQPNSVCPSVIKFSGFSGYKVLEKCWYSPGIYTCGGGYKFRLCIYPNGTNSGKGSHISVGINIMPGKYDDTLEWPLRAQFKVYILNQIEDDNHCNHCINFTDMTPYNIACRKVEEDTRKRGKNLFMKQSLLELNEEEHSQYLCNDAIYLKVEVTLFSATKPWLTQ